MDSILLFGSDTDAGPSCWPEGFKPPSLSSGKRRVVEQWVESVVGSSSQYGNAAWSAEKVVGPPAVDAYGDNGEAWAPRAPRTPHEWLVLRFATAVRVQQIQIRETYNCGAFCRLQLLRRGTEEYVTVVEREPRCGQHPPEIRVEEINVPDDQQFSTDTIRLEFNQQGGDAWYEVDSVKLVGTAAVGLNEVDVTPLSDRQKRLLDSLGALRNDVALSDFTLLANDNKGHDEQKQVSFPVHRTILAARCPFFRKLLDNSEMPSGGTKVIHDIPPKILKMVLDWIYKGDICELSFLDSVNVLAVADYFQIDDLTTHCAQVFGAVFTVENAALLYSHFDSMDVTSVKPLVEACRSFCAEHFLQVSQTAEFAKLSQTQLLSIINEYRDGQEPTE